MSELNKDMKNWTQETGTDKFAKPSLTVEGICKFMEAGLIDKEAAEIEDFLLRLGAYNLWLRNVCGSILATIRSTERNLNARLARGYKSIGKVYATPDVKEAMICDKDDIAYDLKERLTKLRMKYDKVSRIPQSIDSSIRTIENAVRRNNGT
ncbi:hypothetical protein KAR91_49845 [Candidatus Pacearchaeota archaeon]|nr:hypothetical protein [Candidatus Pacearchaeota archaeon]